MKWDSLDKQVEHATDCIVGAILYLVSVRTLKECQYEKTLQRYQFIELV